MRAADLAHLMSINDVHASQENLLRHWELIFDPFPEVLVANFQLCREYLNAPYDLSSAPHRAGVYGRHVLPPAAKDSRYFDYVNVVSARRLLAGSYEGPRSLRKRRNQPPYPTNLTAGPPAFLAWIPSSRTAEL
jgi:hypothetical protein